MRTVWPGTSRSCSSCRCEGRSPSPSAHTTTTDRFILPLAAHALRFSRSFVLRVQPSSQACAHARSHTAWGGMKCIGCHEDRREYDQQGQLRVVCDRRTVAFPLPITQPRRTVCVRWKCVARETGVSCGGTSPTSFCVSFPCCTSARQNTLIFLLRIASLVLRSPRG